MNAFCTNCGAPLAGPVCARCGRPDHWQPSGFGAPADRFDSTAHLPPSTTAWPSTPAVPAGGQEPPRRRLNPAALGASATGAVMAVAAAVVLALLHPWAPAAHATTAAAPATSRPASQSPKTVIIAPPAAPTKTVTVNPPAPNQLGTGSGGETGASDFYGTAVAETCSSDGSHLHADMSITNTSTEAREFIGTLQFYSIGGAWLGQGGFSTTVLTSGATTHAYVDTGDSNDPRARQENLAGTDGSLSCVISDLHSR